VRVVRQCGFRAFKRERKRKAESGSGTGEIAGIARLGLDFRSGIGVRWLWIDTEDFPFHLRVPGNREWIHLDVSDSQRESIVGYGTRRCILMVFVG